jgi:hypothetical protein
MARAGLLVDDGDGHEPTVVFLKSNSMGELALLPCGRNHGTCHNVGLLGDSGHATCLRSEVGCIFLEESRDFISINHHPVIQERSPTTYVDRLQE